MAKLSSPMALLFALTLALALLPVRTVNGDDVSNNSDMWLNMFNLASSSGAVSESTIDEAKKVLGEHQEQEHEQAGSSSYTDSSMILESARNSLAQAAAKKAAADALNNGFGFTVVATPPPSLLDDFSDWVEKARNMDKGIFMMGEAPVEAPVEAPAGSPLSAPAVEAPSNAPVASPELAPLASPKLTLRSIFLW